LRRPAGWVVGLVPGETGGCFDMWLLILYMNGCITDGCAVTLGFETLDECVVAMQTTLDDIDTAFAAFCVQEPKIKI